MIQALRDDCEFYYCPNIKVEWDISKRPIPEGLHFVTHYEPGRYDVAMLHVDQQSIDPLNRKKLIYEQFNRVIADIPKIVINHGTPIYYEYFRALGLLLSDAEMEEKCIRIIREMVGENTMVVNSRTAASEKEWGFGVPIVHGMNPDEWYDLPKEPRVFTALSPAGFDAYYNRGCMGEVADILDETYGYILQYAKLNIDVGNTPEAYKQYLGKSLLYIDTSFRTPMNRARTEAFLSGCCVIQVEGAHDLQYWAKPGENIVLVPDNPEEIARVIAEFLHDGYLRAIAIGQKGREMALREFNYTRYRNDWMNLLEQVTTRKRR
jgi:glycosyltransferase involved in cell wall biosynthesis